MVVEKSVTEKVALLPIRSNLALASVWMVGSQAESARDTPSWLARAASRAARTVGFVRAASASASSMVSAEAGIAAIEHAASMAPCPQCAIRVRRCVSTARLMTLLPRESGVLHHARSCLIGYAGLDKPACAERSACAEPATAVREPGRFEPARRRRTQGRRRDNSGRLGQNAPAMEWMTDYGLFLAKTLTVVVAVVLVVGFVAFTAGRRQAARKHGPSVQVTHLNRHYRRMAVAFERAALSRKAFRLRRKADKAERKRLASAEGGRRRIFVLDFEGDLRARGVSALRSEGDHHPRGGRRGGRSPGQARERGRRPARSRARCVAARPHSCARDPPHGGGRPDRGQRGLHDGLRRRPDPRRPVRVRRLHRSLRARPEPQPPARSPRSRRGTTPGGRAQADRHHAGQEHRSRPGQAPGSARYHARALQGLRGGVSAAARHRARFHRRVLARQGGPCPSTWSTCSARATTTSSRRVARRTSIISGGRDGRACGVGSRRWRSWRSTASRSTSNRERRHGRAGEHLRDRPACGLAWSCTHAAPGPARSTRSRRGRLGAGANGISTPSQNGGASSAPSSGSQYPS